MTTINGHEIHTPGPLKAETFAAFTGHGTEYGVTFYDADLPEGEAGDSYGDLITMVDERNDANPARIEQAQAETMRFATEIVRRWNAYPDLLAALEAALSALETPGDLTDDERGYVIEDAAAAIDKATGQGA